MNKRGLSAIITTLLVVLLVLVAVGIVWGVVGNIIREGAEEVSLGKFTLKADITQASVDNSSNNVSVTVERNPGKGELTGIKFVFSDGVNSEVITRTTTLQELGSETFRFHLADLSVDNLLTISIVPVFKSSTGKELFGNILSNYDVQKANCVADCVGRECGTNGCGGSCGSCDDDWYCDDGACVEGENPCTLTSASWSQTSVVEGTVVTLTVEGTDCDGTDLEYEIYEDDVWPLSDTLMESNIVTGLSTTWITVWEDDNPLPLVTGDPEYYFIATVVDNPSENIQTSQDLTVTQITCNNNNIIEGLEFCDGTAVSGETCASQGFSPGTLTCLNDCSDYDTSSCVAVTQCNDGLDNDADTCTDLADSDCTDASDTIESGSDCSACVVTNTCATISCYNGDVYCYNNCGARTTISDDCDVSESCVGGNCVVQTTGELIIANHDVVDLYDTIPAEWLDEVKKMLLVIYGESHGDAYRVGQDLLEIENPLYIVQTSTSMLPVADNTYLRVSELGGGEEDFYTNTAAINNVINFLQSNSASNPVSVFGFGWCWDMTWHNNPTLTKDSVFSVGWAGSSVSGPEGDLPWGLDSGDTSITGNSVNMDTYLNAVEQYNSAVPGTITFFTTGPVDGNCGNENGYQRYLKHQYMRDYVNTNGGILFDYADILTHDADGSQTTGIWDGHTMPCITSTNLGAADIGHIGSEGALRLAKAMWWMLARMAGWDGTGNPPATCSEGQITSSCLCGGALYSSGYCCSGSYQTGVCGGPLSFTEPFDDSSNIAINNGVTINNLATFSTGGDFQTDPNLISVYEFNDIGNLGVDTKGNNNMVTAQGTPTQSGAIPAGFSGNSVYLDGTSSLLIASGYTFDSTQDHAVCWFAYPTPGISGNQFAKASNYDTWTSGVAAGGYRWATDQGSWNYLDTLNVYTLNQWVHICNVYDSNPVTKRVYIDGNLASTNSPALGMDASSAPWAIGSYCFSSGSCGAYWRGNLYQPMWFNRILSDTEINQLYTNTYFGGVGSGSGDITSIVLSTSDVTEITSISWTESGTSGSSSLQVQVTFDGGSTWHTMINGGSLIDTLSSATMQLQYRVLFNYVDTPVSIDNIVIEWTEA